MNAGGHFQEITLNLESAVDFTLPHNEVLEKRGRCGRCVSNNRKAIVRVLLCLTLLSIATGCMFVLSLGMNMGAQAANGISGRLLMTPWTKKDFLARMLIEKESHSQNISGVTVFNVIEPRERITDVVHVGPLLAGMRDVAKKTPSDQAEIEFGFFLGYLPWKPFLISLNANFTLFYVEALMRQQSTHKTADDCLCYIEYGLPYNAVYLPPPHDITHYFYTLGQASEEKVNLSSACEFEEVIDEFVYLMEHNGVAPEKSNSTTTSHTHTRKVSKSGQVCSRDHACVIYGVPIYQCIVHCNELYTKLLEICVKY